MVNSYDTDEDLIGGGPAPKKDRKIDADHNQQEDVTGVAAAQLRSIIERLERLAEEKKAISDDMRDVMGEAKGNGYDTKAIREILKLRKIEASEREEQDATLDLYKQALGMT